MAIVVPAPGELSMTAKALLRLADHPRDVRTTGNGLEFDVPDSLADRYHGVIGGPEVPDELADRYHGVDKDSSFSDNPDKAPARPVKRRGRAPRVDLEG